MVWSYAGVRPLYDDASGNASAVTRDYVFDLDAGPDRAPLLSVFGGKITTYRKLAEHALEKLQPVMGFAARPLDRRRAPCRAATCRARTSRRSSPRPGARIPGCRSRCCGAGRAPTARGCRRIAGGASRLEDLGRDLGGGLYEAEVALSGRATNGRAPPTTCCGAARGWACMSAQDTVARLEELLDASAELRAAARRPAMSLRLDGVRRVVGDEVWIDDRHARSGGRASSTCCSGRRWPARPR